MIPNLDNSFEIFPDLKEEDIDFRAASLVVGSLWLSSASVMPLEEIREVLNS